LGREISEVYRGEPLTLVCVLKGSFLFMADLARAIEGDVRVEFLGVASYDGVASSGAVQITHDLRQSIEGRHCLLVEDIVDTGLTLSFLLETLRLRSPASLRVASLLDKPSRRKVEVPIDYVGFQIEDVFVIGYGLDLDQRYRNLPYVGIYEPPDAT
jgi:hypoxanthine phosphoribosyltransferase